MGRSNWDAIVLRVGFVALVGAVTATFRPFDLSSLVSAGCGICIGVGATLLEWRIRRAAVRSVAAGALGMLIGAMLGLIFVVALNQTGFMPGRTTQFFQLALTIVGAYLGLVIGIARSDLLAFRRFESSPDQERLSSSKILDTSVLIDGRIADIAEAGFVEGRLVIPQFVLHELQFIADSPDSAKRNRGRRGLDVVYRLQRTPGIEVELATPDFPSVREVDLKLIELAKLRKSKIVTNDFNLNKLAQVQNVGILNINELANALKPVVLPGEAMRVFILKEGKEYDQGVAYLDDGTMVVVDHARRLVSKTIEITVTSVLQTTAGRMIFGRYDERLQGETRATTPPANASSAAASGS